MGGAAHREARRVAAPAAQHRAQAQHGGIAVQRRVPAQRALDGPVQLADRRGDARAEGADVVAIGQVHVAVDEVEHRHRGRLVVVLRGVEAELVVAAGRADAQLHAALPRVARTQVTAPVVGQQDGAAIGRLAEVDGAGADVVLVGEVAADAGDLARPPLELVVRAQREALGDLQRARHLLHRQQHFLELPAGHRHDLGHVHRPLRVGDAVLAEEQALAPLQRVASDAHGALHAGDLALEVDEGIEELAAATVLAARVGQELVGGLAGEAVGRRHGGAQVVAAGVDLGASVAVLAQVDRVAPRVAAEPRAEVLAGEVELGQQVEAVGDLSALEVVVAVVLVDGAGIDRHVQARQRGGRILEPHGGAVLGRQVQAQLVVVAGQVDVEGVGGRQGKSCRHRQREAGGSGHVVSSRVVRARRPA